MVEHGKMEWLLCCAVLRSYALFFCLWFCRQSAWQPVRRGRFVALWSLWQMRAVGSRAAPGWFCCSWPNPPDETSLTRMCNKVGALANVFTARNYLFLPPPPLFTSAVSQEKNYTHWPTQWLSVNQSQVFFFHTARESNFSPKGGN